MLLLNLFATFLSVIAANTLECVSMVNQKCMSRPKIISVNKDKPVFYPLSIKVNTCSGSCNNTNIPMAKLCVPNAVKDINIKVFNLMSKLIESKKIMWHESCK